MTFNIVTSPNKILSRPSNQVERFDKELQRLLGTMYNTMKKERGVGLAAPQIGTPLAISVIESVGEPNKRTGEARPEIPLTYLINPKIIKLGKEKETDVEGCLSLPNIWGDVPRSKSVVVEAQNKKGKKVTIRANDFFARVLQHEIDHLNGVLFPQRIEDLTTLHKLGPEGEILPIVKL